MRCATCPITLLCWGDFVAEDRIRCHKCHAVMQQVGNHWYFWHCPDDQQAPLSVTLVCIECNPIGWVRGNSLNYIINRDCQGNHNAHKQWRKGLYRKLKHQRHEAQNAALAKARQEGLLAEAKKRTYTLIKTPVDTNAGHVSRRHGAKKSDVGRVWKR